MSHEGGLLLSFGGSSPALDSIIIRASDGIYIGKIDGVLGNTDSPMAHVGHIDRKLDLNSLVGEEVNIRAKKPREERYPSSRDRDSRGDGRRDGGSGNFDRGSRDGGRRDGGRGNFDRGSRDGGRGNFDRGSRDGGRGNFDRGNRGRNDSNDGDWDCPKCNNSNFARRTECNRCGEPRGAGGGRRDGGRGNFDRGSRDRRDGGRRDGGRGNFDRGSRDGGATFAHNDWDCPKCNNSNFSFRRECNRCGEPRSGGGGDRRDGGRGNFDRGSRDGGRRDGGRGNFDRGNRGRNDSNDGDWDCPKCNNSNFARRTECNRCGEPRGAGGGRRDGGRGNFDRGSRDGGRRDGGRGNFDRGSRDGGRRDGGRGNFDRDSRGGGGRDGGRGERREFSSRDDDRTKPKENNFRKSKGKRAGHAHNNAPKPIIPRKFNRNSDD
jgi:rRNA processing protein Gar1